jgi:hypothetical protein
MEPRDIMARLYGRSGGNGLELDLQEEDLFVDYPGFLCGNALFNCFRVKGGADIYESDEVLELGSLSEKKPKKPRRKKLKGIQTEIKG